MDIQIQEVHRTPHNMIRKDCYHNTLRLEYKNFCKEISDKQTPIRLIEDVLTESIQARREWRDTAPSIYMPTQHIIPQRTSHYKSRWNRYSNTKKLKEFVTTLSVLQMILNDTVHTEIEIANQHHENVWRHKPPSKRTEETKNRQ